MHVAEGTRTHRGAEDGIQRIQSVYTPLGVDAHTHMYTNCKIAHRNLITDLEIEDTDMHTHSTQNRKMYYTHALTLTHKLHHRLGRTLHTHMHYT